jgi:hypothetical protein
VETLYITLIAHNISFFRLCDGGPQRRPDVFLPLRSRDSAAAASSVLFASSSDFSSDTDDDVDDAERQVRLRTCQSGKRYEQKVPAQPIHGGLFGKIFMMFLLS